MNLKFKFLRQEYYRNLFKQCGENLTINGKPNIYKPELIQIGDNFTINGGCTIAPRGKVYIGNYVTMSRGSQITNGQLDLSKYRHMGFKTVDHIENQREIFINDGAWLCINSIILPGVHINGIGVVVAVGAVVANDINEDYVVVGGIPAKIIKKLN